MPTETKTARQTFAHPRTLEFFEAAHQEGIFYHRPENPNLLATWRRNRKIMTTYFFTSSTGNEIARLYSPPGNSPLTKERIRMIIKRVVEGMWQLGSEELQSKFPIKTIPLKKPESQRLRVVKSGLRGGLSIRVADQIRSGKTPSEILAETSITASQLDSSRRTLINWDLSIPHLIVPNEEYRSFAKILELEPESDKDLADLYEQITHKTFESLVDMKPSPITSIHRLLKDHQITFSRRSIPLLVMRLKLSGIPIGQVIEEVKNGPQAGERSYYFVANHQAERIQQVAREILSDPNWREKAKASTNPSTPSENPFTPRSHELESVHDEVGQN